MTALPTEKPHRSACLGGRHRRRRPKRLRNTALVLLSLAVTVLSGTASAQPREPRFTWPLSPEPAVLRAFQAPESPYGPGHRGVDLAAAEGQQVLAAGAGVVVFAGMLAERGVVAVDHDGDLRTTYEPIVPAVAAGDQVYQGQVLGTVATGHPGCAVPGCLHWGVRRGEEYLDPLALMAVTTDIRLKAWEGDTAEYRSR